ncbi:hypothetical protein Bca4012_084018 [Brassica carinata]
MSASSTTTGGQTRVRTPGIPSKCWCGERIIELISRSNQNLYRRYYRCLYAAKRKLKEDNHIFKWGDEAFTAEIQQLEYQVRMLEEEFQFLKLTIRREDPKIRPNIMILGGCFILIVGVVLRIWMFK